MVIRSLKIIVGNPINLPHLKPKDVERLFLGEWQKETGRQTRRSYPEVSPPPSITITSDGGEASARWMAA